MKNILIVEDNIDIHNLINDVLEEHHYIVLYLKMKLRGFLEEKNQNDGESGMYVRRGLRKGSLKKETW